jgi:hypothetical protein
LASDESSLIEDASIKGPGQSRGFDIQGIFKYDYFLPESTYHAYIEKSDGAILDFDNSTLQVGYVYKVQVTEAGAGMTVDLNPAFEKGETILW